MAVSANTAEIITVILCVLFIAAAITTQISKLCCQP